MTCLQIYFWLFKYVRQSSVLCNSPNAKTTENWNYFTSLFSFSSFSSSILALTVRGELCFFYYILHISLFKLSAFVAPCAHLLRSSLTLYPLRNLSQLLGLFPLIYPFRAIFKIPFNTHTWPTHYIRLLMAYALILGFWWSCCTSLFFFFCNLNFLK